VVVTDLPQAGCLGRLIPLPVTAAQTLAEHIRATPPRESDGQLFTTLAGKLLTHSAYLKVFKSAVLRAGLPPSTSSHDLRHHYASVLLNAGESTFTVADRIGDSPKMVFDTYGHPMPGTEEATAFGYDRQKR
jgi:integrase